MDPAQERAGSEGPDAPAATDVGVAAWALDAGAAAVRAGEPDATGAEP